MWSLFSENYRMERLRLPVAFVTLPCCRMNLALPAPRWAMQGPPAQQS
jgi:hypothetical protein